MAKKTQLSLTATPGKRYSFVAKAQTIFSALFNFIAGKRPFNFNAKTRPFNFNAKVGP